MLMLIKLIQDGINCSSSIKDTLSMKEVKLLESNPNLTKKTDKLFVKRDKKVKSGIVKSGILSTQTMTKTEVQIRVTTLTGVCT